MVDLIEPHENPEIEALAQRIFSINPDRQSWNGDAFSWNDGRNRTGDRRAKAIETAEALIADGWAKTANAREEEQAKPADVIDRLRSFAKQYTEDPTRLLSGATVAADLHDLTDDLTSEASPLLAAFFPKDPAQKSMWRLLGETLDHGPRPAATGERPEDRTSPIDLTPLVATAVNLLTTAGVRADEALLYEALGTIANQDFARAWLPGLSEPTFQQIVQALNALVQHGAATKTGAAYELTFKGVKIVYDQKADLTSSLRDFVIDRLPGLKSAGSAGAEASGGSIIDALQSIEKQITDMPEPYILAKDVIPAWRIGRDEAARLVRDAIESKQA